MLGVKIKMVWKPVSSPSKKEMSEFLSEHRRSARFLVDESLGEEVAKQIRELGWNVKYVDEVGLRGHADEDVYAYAHKENRVILTHDDDFMDNRLFSFSICSEQDDSGDVDSYSAFLIFRSTHPYGRGYG